MKLVIAGIISLVVLVNCVSAIELPIPPFGQDVADRLLEHHTIYIPVTGSVTGDFSKAYAVLQSSNVLERVDAVYKALLPKGEKCDFAIHSTSNGHYYCINTSNERSELYDICLSGSPTSNSFGRIMYVQGKRNFGMFESLLSMKVSRSEDPTSNILIYHADVYIYPHCMALRVFLKYFPGVQHSGTDYGIYIDCETNSVIQVW
jgi:hypothetical protein